MCVREEVTGICESTVKLLQAILNEILIRLANFGDTNSLSHGPGATYPVKQQS